MRHGDYMVQVDADFGRGGDRLKVARGTLGGTRSLLYTKSTWVDTSPDVLLDDQDDAWGDFGLALPHGMLEALQAELGPQHSAPEIKRLEEALQVERERVNGLLGRALTPESWAWANRLRARRES